MAPGRFPTPLLFNDMKQHLIEPRTKWRKQSYSLSLLSLLICAGGFGCANLPRDQHGATERIRQKRVLVVGVSRGEEPSALQTQEKRLVEKIAQRLGARVQWRPGNAHQLLQDLEELKLPIVAAEISSDSPFGEDVGLSQPYMKDGPHHKDYCLAVAPGENHLLFLIDRIILEEQKESGS